MILHKHKNNNKKQNYLEIDNSECKYVLIRQSLYIYVNKRNDSGTLGIGE